MHTEHIIHDVDKIVLCKTISEGETGRHQRTLLVTTEDEIIVALRFTSFNEQLLRSLEINENN